MCHCGKTKMPIFQMDKLNQKQKLWTLNKKKKTVPLHFTQTDLLFSSSPPLSPTGVTVPESLVQVASPSKHLPRLPWHASRYPPFHSTHHRRNVDDCFFKSQAIRSHLRSQMWPQWQLRLQEKERYFLLFYS